MKYIFMNSREIYEKLNVIPKASKYPTLLTSGFFLLTAPIVFVNKDSYYVNLFSQFKLNFCKRILEINIEEFFYRKFQNFDARPYSKRSLWNWRSLNFWQLWGVMSDKPPKTHLRVKITWLTQQEHTLSKRTFSMKFCEIIERFSTSSFSLI